MFHFLFFFVCFFAGVDQIAPRTDEELWACGWALHWVHSCCDDGRRQIVGNSSNQES
jgi:hypothetical protein